MLCRIKYQNTKKKNNRETLFTIYLAKNLANFLKTFTNLIFSLVRNLLRHPLKVHEEMKIDNRVIFLPDVDEETTLFLQSLGEQP